MQAIETSYKGYRFRSRLEARWAVFFDRMGIEFEYEPEGFKLDSGVCYLPDFRIPALDVYVEVKPDQFAFADLEKCVEFAMQRPLLLIVGTPTKERMFLLGRDAAWLVQHHQEDVMDEQTRCDTEVHLTLSLGRERVRFGLPAHDGNWGLVYSSAYIERTIGEALAAGKSARFEHGEVANA